MEDVHVYFMAPLKCSETQLRASTLCMRSVAPRLITGCGGGAATCRECLKRLDRLLAENQRLLDSCTKEKDLASLREHHQQLLALKSN